MSIALKLKGMFVVSDVILLDYSLLQPRSMNQRLSYPRIARGVITAAMNN